MAPRLDPMARIPRLRKGAPEASQAPETPIDPPTEVTSGDPLAADRAPATDGTTDSIASGDPLGAAAPAPEPADPAPEVGAPSAEAPATDVPPPATVGGLFESATPQAPEAVSVVEPAPAPEPAPVVEPTLAPGPSAMEPNPTPAAEATPVVETTPAPAPEAGAVSATEVVEQPTVVAPVVGTAEDSATVVEEAPADAAPRFRDRARIRRRLRYLRRYRELAFRDLGGLTFDLHRFGRDRPDLVAQKLENLKTVDQELRTLETALRDRQDITRLREPGIAACPRCQTLHDSDANFCPGCGTPLRGSVVREAAQVSVAPVEQPAAPPTSPTAPPS